jgi:hypothetical protein
MLAFALYGLWRGKGGCMNKKNWWIWTLLALVIAGFVGVAIWTAVDPSVMDSYNKTKATETSFQTALVEKAQVVVPWAPVTARIHFQSDEGTLLTRDVKIYSYGANPKGGTYAQYYYPADNTKLIPIRKAFIEPVKIAKVEPSWISEKWNDFSVWGREALKPVSNWKWWGLYGELTNKIGPFAGP